MPLIKRIEIKQILPCAVERDKIRVIAGLGADVREALPYLNATHKGARYNPSSQTMMIKNGGFAFAIYPTEVKAKKFCDVEEAVQEIGRVVDQLNRAWEERATITPSFERGTRLNAMLLFKSLPATNCRACGVASCMAFAVKLLEGEVSVLRCQPLFEPTYKDKRIALLTLLDDAGLEVPVDFLA